MRQRALIATSVIALVVIAFAIWQLLVSDSEPARATSTAAAVPSTGTRPKAGSLASNRAPDRRAMPATPGGPSIGPASDGAELDAALQHASLAWRASIEPDLMGCLPPPGPESRPHDVRVSFHWEETLSGPEVQRFVVTGVRAAGATTPPTADVQRCLDALIGTSLDIEAPVDAVADDGENYSYPMSVLWGEGP